MVALSRKEVLGLMSGVNQSTALAHNFQLFSPVLAKIACGKPVRRGCERCCLSDAGGLGQADKGVGKVMDAKVNGGPFACTIGCPASPDYWCLRRFS
jgi:hypothetical protein